MFLNVSWQTGKYTNNGSYRTWLDQIDRNLVNVKLQLNYRTGHFLFNTVTTQANGGPSRVCLQSYLQISKVKTQEEEEKTSSAKLRFS